MSDLDYLNGLLGLPWQRGAAGPQAYDCWGLVVEVERALFGRTLPMIAEPPETKEELQAFVALHAARKQWCVVERPVHGGVVEMSHQGDPFHIGVYLDVDGGGIFHSVSPSPRGGPTRLGGVRFDPILKLQASGWRRFVYHDWNG
jgi:hypothetical protein